MKTIEMGQLLYTGTVTVSKISTNDLVIFIINRSDNR